MRVVLLLAVLASSALASFYETVMLTPEAITAGLEEGMMLSGDTSMSMGTARLLYDSEDMRMWYNIEFTGLTGPVTGAYFHGPARPNETAPVTEDITVPMGGMSPLLGSVALDMMDEMQLRSGIWYITLRTAENPMIGEVRGQVLANEPNIYQAAVPLSTEAVLAGGGVLADEAAVMDAAGRSIVLYTPATGRVDWMVLFTGLSSDAILAHFHGPAAADAMAGVLVDIFIETSMSPHVGSAIMPEANREAFFRQNMTYINLHTANNMPGELRGQVMGFQLVEAPMITNPPANPDNPAEQEGNNSGFQLSSMAALALAAVAALIA